MIRIFRVSIPAGVAGLLISEIALTSLCFYAAAYVILGAGVGAYFLDEGGLIRTALAVASIILGLYFVNLYTRVRVKSRIRLLQDLCQVTGIALLAQGLIAYANPDLKLGRGIMLWGTMMSLAALFGWRLFYARFILDAIRERLLFVGSNQVVEEMADHIVAHPELGMTIAGYLTDGMAPGTQLSGGTVLGPVSDVPAIATSLRPTRIVVGTNGSGDRMPVAGLLDLEVPGFAIEEAGSTYEAVCARVCTKDLRPGQLIFSGELGPGPGSLFRQDILNYSLSLIAAPAMLLTMAMIAVVVKLSSPGPILSRQAGVGKGGVPFQIYRFRTTQQGAGKWLRRLRLDELPQFFNVMKGEMSLVGPRPDRPEFVKILCEQIPYYRQRQSVKPGITGWAQINEGGSDKLEDTVTMLEYDFYFIKNLSTSLVVYILFHTLKADMLSPGEQS